VATGALLDPDHVTTAAPRKRRRGDPLFPRGELGASVLDAIRKSTGAVTAHGISERLLAAKGVPADDKRMRRAIEKPHREYHSCILCQNT
jgi:hypothetical protein